MSGWTVVDTATNKSLPVGGTQNSGYGSAYVTPNPASTDPVGKLRVSTPQALIDTDFEYGTQPTKWETIALQNNRPSVYYIPQAPLPVTALTGTATADQVTLTLATSTTIANNTPIYIQNSLNSTINGWAWIVTGGTGTSFTIVYAPGTTNTTNTAQYFSPTSCYVYSGYFYSGAGIQTGTNPIVVTSGTVLTVTTVGAHGLTKGSLVYFNGANIAGGATNVNGAYIVATVPGYNTFTVTATGASGSPTATAGNNVIYARPAGYVEPRTFDGGVSFSAGSAVPNQQLIRQTRRYFRYQSGKGIQFSTGSCLKPALFVTSLINSAGTVTVTTRYNHNLVAGTQIQVAGCIQGYFNGTYTVATVTSPTTFTYVVSVSNFVTATGQFRISPLNWYGSTSRIGFFDQQNGMFFEFDGQTLYTVLRNSTNQISGAVAVTNGSAAVVGTGTAFLTQLQPGQFIVIRGQSYRVVQIVDDSNLSVTPEYRGATTSNAVVSQTIDYRVPQSQWNIDKFDGTGPSGYNIDLTRMQMFYIDYSWYGAGYIRWGFRGTNGLVTYVNQLQNNNKQFEAYMRSGNMSAHYEVSGIPPSTFTSSGLTNGTSQINGDITAQQTTIPVLQTAVLKAPGVVRNQSTGEYIYYTGLSTNSGAGNLLNCTRGFGGTSPAASTSSPTLDVSSFILDNAAGFPTSQVGATTLQVKMQGANGSIEYVGYKGILGNGVVWGLTRGQAGGAGISPFTAGVTSSVELATPDSVPSLSHWGSSAIMDGLFNDDKSLIFNYGTNALTTTTSITQVTPILAIRIAPSVDNGQTGLLGTKEIINRMQLQLSELGIYATGPLLVNLVLNGYTTGTFSGTFASPITQGVGAYTSSLAQVAQNTTNSVTLVGGESVSAAFTNSNGQTVLDLSQVRDLGNSILGGGTSNTLPTAQAGFYPDGPDILYVCVTPLTATAITVNARLSWKEAQA